MLLKCAIICGSLWKFSHFAFIYWSANLTCIFNFYGNFVVLVFKIIILWVTQESIHKTIVFDFETSTLPSQLMTAIGAIITNISVCFILKSGFHDSLALI